MIAPAEREQIRHWVDDACEAGARRARACALLGLSVRTLQRWAQPSAPLRDRRQCRRTQPAHNALSDAERATVLAIANSAEFADLPPSQIVPILAERGCYVASESSFYRTLRQARQLQHRQSTRPAQPRARPQPLCASAPNQLYAWDITFLPTTVRGHFLYLYLVLDLYSRKIVGWSVHVTQTSEHAARLFEQISEREGVRAGQLWVHSDNGSPMKGATLLATLQRLGIMPSFSRPAVSNDNAYAEAMFRTLKYRPTQPLGPFETLEHAQRWVAEFVHWYNHYHRHSAIRFLTPAQRHAGQDQRILAQRQTTYACARARRPERWSRGTRNWQPVGAVFLNPATECAKPMTTQRSEKVA